MYGCGEQEVGVASGSGWNLFGVASGCGCKEVYRLYYLSLIFVIFLIVFRSYSSTFCN